MKLSGRETFMIFALIFIVMFAGYWFLILTPIKQAMTDSVNEYNGIRSQYNYEIAIIDNVGNLETDLEELNAQVTDYENRLLPELRPEVITEHLVKILADNGLTKVTDIGCTLPTFEQIMNSDGTYSANNVEWLTINLKASGTDGITPGGTDKIGYDQFMSAVKQIESVNPDAIHVSSISMQETNQGFQYFLISVDVFAFNLPSRISSIDTSEPYINWNREPVPVGGLWGRPYDSIPMSLIQPGFFRPFASDFTGSGVITPPAVTAEPTPTPAA